MRCVIKVIGWDLSEFKLISRAFTDAFRRWLSVAAASSRTGSRFEDRKPFISVQANSVAECDGMRLEVQRETHGASDALFDVCVCTAQHFTLLLVVVSLSTSLLPYIVLQTVVRE